MNGNIIPNVQDWNQGAMNCWPTTWPILVPSVESTEMLIAKIRARLVDVEHQLKNVTKLEAERRTLLRMIEAYDGK